MKNCVVCGNQLPDEAMVCSRCGFPMHQRAFLSEAHYRAWMQETVEPVRLNWQRQELERQKKQIEEQNQQIEELKRQLEEQEQIVEEFLDEEKIELEKNSDLKEKTDIGRENSTDELKEKKKNINRILIVIGIVTMAVVTGLIGYRVVVLSTESNISINKETQIDNSSTEIVPKKLTASIGVAAKEVEFSQKQLGKANEVGFDLNLFENIPLTSEEENIAWLEKNGYKYEKSWEEGNITIKINGDDLVDVIYSDEEDGEKPNYLLCYYYNKNDSKDFEIQRTIKELMKELHSDGEYNADDESYDYYDGVMEYWINSDCAERIVRKVSNQQEINNDVEQLIQALSEMPNISDKQQTLDWIDKSGYSYEDDLENETCSMNWGFWSCEYKYIDSYKLVFRIWPGNPKKYYQTIKEKFKETGYQIEDNGKYDDGSPYIDYLISEGNWRKKTVLSYDPLYHCVNLAVEPDES